MTTSISILPTTHETSDGTLRDLLPGIELTPRVVEALDDDNWRLDADEASELAEVAAIARALVVRLRAADARRLAEIGAAWAAWETWQAEAEAGEAVMA